MKERKMNPEVDMFLSRTTQWKEEFEWLRMMMLDTRLTEKLKWGVPCYTLQDRNVVLIHGFKAYCALLFFKGALLKDPKGILIRQTENVQSSRQIRFTGLKEIVKMEPILKAYINEAIGVEKSGRKVDIRKKPVSVVPEEFQVKCTDNPALKKAFDALTPGRQRAYLLYFSSAKQSKTRESRIEKYIQHILNGKGLDD
jgi:uncharacterized protein YdeI (YjbR/CyaY-like superfamily)